jgi:hypothetical protein
MALEDVPAFAATSKGLLAHSAKDTLWRAFALRNCLHLSTTFSLLPSPKPPFKSLFRNAFEAKRASVVNELSQSEVPTVTFDDYIFQYDILVEGQIIESWAGKADFSMPFTLPSTIAAGPVVYVVLPLTREGARIVEDALVRLNEVVKDDEKMERRAIDGASCNRYTNSVPAVWKSQR